MDIYANILSWEWITTAVIIASVFSLIYGLIFFKTKFGEKIKPIHSGFIGLVIGFSTILLSSFIN